MPKHIQQTIVPFMNDHVNLVYETLDPAAKVKDFFDFFRGYTEAVDFTLDEEDDWRNVRWSHDAVTAAVRDTIGFFNAHHNEFNELFYTAGTRFLYARNGDGVTFMDDSFDEFATDLQEAARLYEELDAYLGNDGNLHSMSEIRYELAEEGK